MVGESKDRKAAIAICQLLLEERSDPNLLPFNGVGALDAAVEARDVELIKVYRARGGICVWPVFISVLLDRSVSCSYYSLFTSPLSLLLFSLYYSSLSAVFSIYSLHNHTLNFHEACYLAIFSFSENVAMETNHGPIKG